jgi:hypothetical protein
LTFKNKRFKIFLSFLHTISNLFNHLKFRLDHLIKILIRQYMNILYCFGYSGRIIPGGIYHLCFRYFLWVVIWPIWAKYNIFLLIVILLAARFGLMMFFSIVNLIKRNGEFVRLCDKDLTGAAADLFRIWLCTSIAEMGFFLL